MHPWPSKSQTAQETPDAAAVHDFVAPVNWTMLYVYVMNLPTTAQNNYQRRAVAQALDDSSALELAQINSPGYKSMELAKN